MKFCPSGKVFQSLKSSVAMVSMISLFTTGLPLLNATSTQAQPASPGPTLLGQQPAIRPTTPNRLPNHIRRAVLQAHSRQVRLPINQLSVAAFSRESWSDTCLGLGRPEEGCGAMMVNGWRVEVRHANSRWFYRTDSTGQSIRLESTNNVGSLPQAVGQKVLEIASLDLGVPISQLRIVAGRPQTWDGCLGIAGPNTPCTMIGIPGWQVIVAGPQQYSVYHLDQYATRVKRNPTTSAKGSIIPSFWQPDPGMLPARDIIFQSLSSGGIAGQSYKTVLQRDGQVLRFDLRRQNPTVPTLIRKLTPDQMRTFINTLQQNEFEDFLGFNYSASIGADYFSIALITPGRQQGMQYVDMVQDQTPPKLQQIIRAWNQITSPNRP